MLAFPLHQILPQYFFQSKYSVAESLLLHPCQCLQTRLGSHDSERSPSLVLRSPTVDALKPLLFVYSGLHTSSRCSSGDVVFTPCIHSQKKTK